MSVNNESQNLAGGAVVEKHLPQGGVYASLFDKINLTPVAELGDLNGFDDTTVMAETSADARVTAAVKVFILTEAVRKRPYSVVLLDEVEKAHRDVMNLFYQVFDRGFMRDGEGREIDFRNTVILMTSNLGGDPIMQLLDDRPEATEVDLHELLRPILRDRFQPALLARFQTVIYRPLAETAMRTIVQMKLAQVSKRLHRHYGVATHIDESLYDALTAACLLPDTGARNVDSLLNQQILPVLSQQLLSHMAEKRELSSLLLGWSEDNGVALEFSEAGGVAL